MEWGGKGVYFQSLGTMLPPWRLLATPGRRKGNSVVSEPTMLSPILMQPARTTQCCASNSVLACRALLHCIAHVIGLIETISVQNIHLVSLVMAMVDVTITATITTSLIVIPTTRPLVT